MSAWRVGLSLLALMIVLPVVGQEKREEKKPAAKDKVEKKEEKKSEPKEDKKAGLPVNKYQFVNKIAGRITNSDTEEMLIEVEVRVPTSRTGSRSEKITWSMANDVKVRTLKLAEKLDDKGKPMQYTPLEKSKLKGNDSKTPGYAAELSALKNGQVVEVELSTYKPAPGKKKADEDEKPFVTMIVIAEEPPKTIDKKKK